MWRDTLRVMEITLEPPRAVLLLLGMPLLVALALFLAIKVGNKQISWAARVVPVVLATIPAVIVVSVAFQKRTFGWSDAGIRDDAFGSPVVLAWSDIEEARRVPDVWRSEWGLSLRTFGTAYGPYRAGEFRLHNGQSARVFMMTNVRDAIVLRAHGATYVYAPEPFEPFAATVALHVH